MFGQWKKIQKLGAVSRRSISFYEDRSKIVDRTGKKVERFAPSRNILAGFGVFVVGIVSLAIFKSRNQEEIIIPKSKTSQPTSDPKGTVQ